MTAEQARGHQTVHATFELVALTTAEDGLYVLEGLTLLSFDTDV